MKQSLLIANFDPEMTWQIIKRCIEITIELIVFTEGT
jgi:hypothetical protein